MSESTIEGIDEIIAKFKELEQVPQTIVTSAAKKGATMAMNYAIANLQPKNGAFLGRHGRTESHESGDLKKAIRLKRETTAKGKTVYRITTTWYARFVDLKFTTHRGTRKTGIVKLDTIEGNHFLRRALTEHYDEIKDAMIEELAKGINKTHGK